MQLVLRARNTSFLFILPLRSVQRRPRSFGGAHSSMRVWALKLCSAVQELSCGNSFLLDVNVFGVRIATGLADQDQGQTSSLRWHMRAYMTCNTSHYRLVLSAICQVIFSPLTHCRPSPILTRLCKVRNRERREAKEVACQDLNGAYCATAIR